MYILLIVNYLPHRPHLIEISQQIGKTNWIVTIIYTRRMYTFKDMTIRQDKMFGPTWQNLKALRVVWCWLETFLIEVCLADIEIIQYWDKKIDGGIAFSQTTFVNLCLKELIVHGVTHVSSVTLADILNLCLIYLNRKWCFKVIVTCRSRVA